MLKVYSGEFVKKDGDTRKMLFAKVQDLPEELLPEAKGGKKAKLPEGMELVWDVEERFYRVFNFNTIIGELKETRIDLATLTQSNGVKDGY